MRHVRTPRIRAPRIAVALLLFGLLGTLVPAGSAHETGVSHDDYEDIVERLERARELAREAAHEEEHLTEDIAETRSERRAAEIELEELSALVGRAEDRLEETQGVLDRMESELDRKDAELQEALEELQATHDLVQERAVEVYKAGPVSFAEFLLGAEDLRSLVSRVEFVHRVFRKDEERIVSLEEQKARVTEERRQVEELRDRAAEQVEIVRAERSRMATLERQVGARAATLQTELAEQYDDLGDAQARKEQYLRQQEELEAESQRVAALLRGRTEGEATVGRGGMIWPASGPLTSGYGWRTHPIFGTKRFHAGIDIGAPTGAPVSAAATGTVVHASSKGGYGNAVIIDHGGGIATLYGHLSSVSTSAGATVGRGETVGGVGCSGYCTGPHLHFEVRVNGEPQNPLQWLP